MPGQKRWFSARSRFRMGGGAAMVTVIVIAGAVLINLISARLSVKMDLSDLKLYSLSDQTSAILSSISDPVTIHATFREGTAPTEISEALKRYAESSALVDVRFVDLERAPGFSRRFAGANGEVVPGSLVVTNATGERFRTIQYHELFETGVDRNTGQQTVRGVQLERQVSSALAYVASGRTYRIYELTGHGEDPLARLGMSAELNTPGTTSIMLNLLSAQRVPGDADLVLIAAPVDDMQDPEADALREHIERGGNMLVLLNPGVDLPNLAGLLSTYGVAWEPGFVMEGDQTRRVAGNPFILLPQLMDHEITEPLERARLGVTFPASVALHASQLRRQDVRISSIVQSSANSWFRAAIDDPSPTRRPGEIHGPFTLAVAVEIHNVHGTPGRLLVAGSNHFIHPGNPAPAPGNRDLFLNMVSWSLNRTEGSSIAPKYFFSMPMHTDGVTALLLLALFVVIIPGGILMTGLGVWLWRRNR